MWSLTPSYDAYETGMLPLSRGSPTTARSLTNRKLALIGSDNPYSKTIYNGIKKSFTEAGWTITVDEMVPFGQVYDWRAILAKIRSNPPDLVVNTDYLPANEATFLEQFLEAPTKSLLFLQYPPSGARIREADRRQVDGRALRPLGRSHPQPQEPARQRDRRQVQG